MSFMPQDYQVPKSNQQYLNVSKATNGVDNIVRILSKPILGWVDWQDKKPMRTHYRDKKPNPVDPKYPVKHFWAMVVWDYTDKLVKIMEITQSSIQDVLYNLDCDEAWGDPTRYDINIRKSGEGLDTKYSVTPRPPKPVDQSILDAYKEANPNLEALFVNSDPFSGEATTANEGTITPSEEQINDYDGPERDDEIAIENIPF